MFYYLIDDFYSFQLSKLLFLLNSSKNISEFHEIQMGAKMFRYRIINMDFENTAVLEQNVETNNEKLINYELK